MDSFTKKISRTGVILALVGVALLWISLGDAITSFKPARSFEDVLENGAAPGDHVAGQAPYLLDVFADLQTWSENTKTHSTTPKKTTFRYYVLPAGDGYVGMAVSSKNFSQADSLVKQTYEYLLGEGGAPTAELTADARVAVMEEELAALFREDLREYYGYTDRDIEALGAPLIVEPRAFGTIRAFCAVGAAAFAAGAVMLVLHWRKAGKLLRAVEEPRRGPELD